MSKHTLPPKAAKIQEAFQQLCEWRPYTQAQVLIEHVNSALSKILEREKSFAALDVKLARALTEKSLHLISHYTNYNEEQQSLIIGAVRYYICHIDSLPDDEARIGLDDDALVMNHVLEKLGFSEGYIET